MAETEEAIIGGKCVLCGCEFVTGISHAHYCPNCGSKNWIEPPKIWTREIVKETENGPKTYSYYMATWKEGDKTRNMHVGSCDTMSLEEAQQKADEAQQKAMCLKIETLNCMANLLK